MIQYILESIAFQLVFLVIYDFFLKRETFFQWNRVYLIGTYILSLVLPWIKIEAFKTTVSEQYVMYPQFLLNIDAVSPTVEKSSQFTISMESAIFFGGMILAALYFGYKLFQIYRLRISGEVHFFPKFTRVVVSNSELAFSFFTSIFLGDKVLEKEHKSIIQHELVHIEQKHSWDLLFFELMRIVGWFNPLVYVYQNRVSELHEFIADAHVAKTHKKEQYETLLSQIFQTQHISFINQFFKTSLIKKRIVMLQKAKSKSVWQLKYLVLVPLVLGMLVYSSCESDTKELTNDEYGIDDQKSIEQITKDLQNEDSEEIERQLGVFMDRMIIDKEILSKEEYFKFKILSYKAFAKPKVKIDQGDTLYYLGSDTSFRNPTDQEYQTYVNRTKAFQILDFDLWVSIDPNELDIRKIEKEDKNLGPGDFISVNNVRDLTGDEIRNINRKIASIDFNGRFLYISDNQNAFLITKFKIENRIGGEAKKTNSEDAELPFVYVEEAPIFPGCENAEDKRACFKSKMQEHVVEHFRYPEEAQEADIQGKVYVNFVIDEEGVITEIRKRGPDVSLENETERIIGLLPKMTPENIKVRR
ncbi:M56 family metallopeptidase [Maribacter halichondriae]|uniref:M56 family metallopeptidase n=1 Tax=Maribacter halichondriae TaxID=2980554 RepID=UPI0023599B4D|nr:M56 family metallopeptidase [Maribacter sp. Hal144]